MPGQQEDVAKAEARFSKPDGYGMLFTNGTGTGKTFTGLGVVKRFARQGKSNVLIIVPDDKIAADWIKSGKALGLTITPLRDTKDAGSGITVATYANVGDNDALVTREWDLFVADEAHELMKSADGYVTKSLAALRALSLHPDGAIRRYEMLNRADIEKMAALTEQINKNRRLMAKDDTMDQMVRALQEETERLEAEHVAIGKKLQEARDKVREDVLARQGEKRPRALFLSATPFAYEVNIDWANGYLFDYDEGQPAGDRGTRRYNEGNNRDRFFMTHFGYRMRYNKLTKPDLSKVDVGLLQRQFNTWLKKRGVLSSRMLEVEADYDRRFVLVDSAIGNRIDEALSWIDEQRLADSTGFGSLRSAIDEQFDYLSRRYLLEAIKATEAVPIVREHLRLGRKVVVFHDYKKGGGFNPFDIKPIRDLPPDPQMREGQIAFNDALAKFREKFGDLVSAPLGSLPSPIEVFKREFPDVLLVNGDEKKSDLLARYEKFQDDASGPQVMLVQSAKNKGWSGHDTTGKHQRVLINLGLPTAPTLAIQQEGRIYRTGQVSNAIIRYLNTGTNWERLAFAATIAGRASTAENLAMGEHARALKDAFIMAFEESDAYPPGHEGEGTGGKARDAAANNALTEYDRAKAIYWGAQKKSSRTKAQEGVDYFATPEPVGLKMVEWLGLRGGEDVLEPSAGHGAIARWFPENVKRTVVEPSSALRARLAMVMDPNADRFVGDKFEDLHVANKYDGIAMNPPFGHGGATAIEHLAKAAKHLRDGGRIVALIPTGPAADKRFDQWMYGTEQVPVKPVLTDEKLGAIYPGDTIRSRASWAPEGKVVRSRDGNLMVKVAGQPGETMVALSSVTEVQPTGARTRDVRPAEDIYMVGEVRLPRVTFERAATSVATRIVILEKHSDPAKAPAAGSTIDLSGITDINELFDRLEGISMPARAMSPEQEADANKPAGQQADAQAPTGKINRGGLPIVEHITRTGKKIRGVIRTDLTKEKAQEIDPYTFRKDGGYFIREKYLKGDDDTLRFSRRASDQETRDTERKTVDVAPIRAAIAAAYGDALDRMQARGMVTLALTEAEALQAAAAARAARRGTSEADELRSLQAQVQASRSPMKSVDANIRRGLQALTRALEERTTVHRAMFRSGLGWVDFVWGDAGTVKPSGKTTGAMGLAHILEARQRKDGMTEAEAIRLMQGIVQAVASGREIRRYQFDRSVKAVVEHEGVKVILTRRDGSNTWVLSGWKRDNPGDSRAGYVAPAATAPAPTTAQREGVAGSGLSMEPGDLDVKLSADGRLQGFFDRATGKAFLVAESLTPETAPGVFLHEVGVHMAASKDGKRRMQALFAKAKAMVTHQSKSPFLRRVADRMAAAGETSGEEAAAYIAEEYERDRLSAPRAVVQWMRDAIAAVRAWLFVRGMDVKLRPADIAAIARANVKRLSRDRASDAALTRDGEGVESGDVAASRSRVNKDKSPAQRADEILAKRAGSRAPLDALAKTITRVTGIDRLAGAIYDGAAYLLDRSTPEKVKAGVVSDYGVPEAVLDRRVLLQAHQRVQLRKAGQLIDKLATLTRAESRVAYEWMNMDGSDPRAYLSMMQGLPEESVKVLTDIQKMIDDLSKEAVRLGQLSPEAYERHKFAYLRRSYAKHVLEASQSEKAKRARVISILGDQYKGRGMTDAVPMDKLKAADWWGRKTAKGKADTALKGEKFIRLERRAPSGEGTMALPGMSGKPRGRLLESVYWPANEPIPTKYAEWDREGTWEVRDVKGGNVIMWRDFTKEEREMMGEIDEARFAIAKTLHGMIHDVEVGRYLEWLSQNYAKKEGEAIPGKVVEASERYKDSFTPQEWVRVPDTKIPGTNVYKYGKLAGQYVPGPIWNDLRQVVNGQFRPFGDTYDKILRAWKISKTALSPAVHMNNVMANFVMADWHDVGAAHIAKALRIILAASQRDGKGVLGAIGNQAARLGIADRDAAREILHRYLDSGGDLGAWVTSEIKQEQLEPLLKALEQELAATAGNSVQAQVGVFSALQHALMLRFPEAWEAFKGSRVGGAVVQEGKNLFDLYQHEDDVFRLAAWLKAKEDGKSDIEAGKAARKSFLDYHINAPWIQAMRNSAWPFVSFTYRAVPMLAEIAGKKPHKLFKLMAIAGLLNAFGVMMAGGDEDDERKLLPEEKAGRIWGMVPKLIRMPWNDAHGSPVYLDIRRWVPVGDIFDVGAGHAAIPVLPGLMPGGPLMILGEVLFNRSAFTGRPITLGTDTGLQQAAKVADHLYKAFMPNLLGVPNTYATEGLIGSMTGPFGRELSTPQAVASAFGIKLGSYPSDVLRRNLVSKAEAQMMEIDRNISQLKRQLQRGRLTQEEFQERVQVELEKKRKVQKELMEKLN